MAKVNFRTNVLLKSIIGKDLITDDNIAVLELVKNSFDAGSNIVELEFRNSIINIDVLLGDSLKDTPQLIISDLGKGMSEYDLINKWLNIAYSEKKEKREEYGRVLAGNKGVGRFSCDKLGRFLTIYTRQKGGSYIKLFIDWEWFEVNNKIDLNIQDIDLETIIIPSAEFEKISGFKSFEEGTILEISSLRENWNHSKILSLKRQLERLINPNQSFKSSAFTIKIIAEDFLNFEKDFEDYEKVNGNVNNRIFEKLSFKVTSIQSKISRDGQYIITALVDRGNTIFTLVEKNKFSLLKNIRIYIYYLNTYSKIYFTKQTGIRSVDFGSIFLFLNGFRVPPYGDYGDDWLGIEQRKNQGYNRYLGTREIVGRIEIQDADENFKVISSRSGVVNNEYFSQLTKSESPFGYYYKIFRRLERFVVEGIRWDTVAHDKNIDEVNNSDWDESQEKFAEDSLTRNRRILLIIKNIIDAKSEDIIRLHVNESFVSDLIEQETERIKNVVDEITEKLKAKNLTPQEISIFLDKINLSREELKSLFDIVSPYSGDPSLIKETETDLGQKYDKLFEEKNRLLIKLEEEKEARQKAENEKKEVEFYLEEAKSQNLFLKSIKSQDFNEVLNLMHHIGISTGTIQNYVKGVVFKLDNNLQFTEGELKDVFSNLNIELNKIYSISKFATKANFKVETKKSEIDIVSFIEQYILNISKPLLPQEWEIKIVENDIEKFMVEFKPLELIIILDNLISNSKKAIRKKIESGEKFIPEIKVNFILIDEQNLEINYSDNGFGIENEFIDKIFDYGFTKTEGSGLGLTHVRELLENLGGEILVIDNFPEGAKFKILIKKN